MTEGGAHETAVIGLIPRECRRVEERLLSSVDILSKETCLAETVTAPAPPDATEAVLLRIVKIPALGARDVLLGGSALIVSLLPCLLRPRGRIVASDAFESARRRTESKGSLNDGGAFSSFEVLVDFLSFLGAIRIGLEMAGTRAGTGAGDASCGLGLGPKKSRILPFKEALLAFVSRTRAISQICRRETVV